jgi:hypothetical protein
MARMDGAGCRTFEVKRVFGVWSVVVFLHRARSFAGDRDYEFRTLTSILRRSSLDFFRRIPQVGVWDGINVL